MTAAFNRVRGFMRVTVPPRGSSRWGSAWGTQPVRRVLREETGLCQGSEGHGFHPVGEGEAAGAGIDDGHAFQAQVVEGDRGRQARRVDTLALDIEEPAPAAKQQVDLRALMGRPERRLGVGLGGEDLFDREPLPRGAELGVAQERGVILDAEELVEEAAVADADLGDFTCRLRRLACHGRNWRSTSASVSRSRCRPTVGSRTPSARAGSALFQVWLWSCATIVQKRRIAVEDTRSPHCGRSRSTIVSIKSP